MTTTTTQQPRHAAERFLPIYAATRAQQGIQRPPGHIDGDALAAAQKTVNLSVDTDLWALVAEQGSTPHAAPSATVTPLPLDTSEDEKRGALAAVLRRWRRLTSLTQLALAEPRVESPTSEEAR